MKIRPAPIVVFLVFGLFMYLLACFLPVGDFDFFGRKVSYIVLAATGVLVVAVGVYQFYRAGTTVDPRDPSKSTQLVTYGLYRYSRNPMYLGLLLLLLSWGLYLGNAFNTITAALFVAYMNRFQISKEEEALSRLFGKEYQQYCLAVRRWF